MVISPSADETVLAGESVEAYLERVVRLKLDAVLHALRQKPAERAPMILVADTSVILGVDILGKPESTEEARAMLTRLSGKTHEVHTRFAIGHLGGVLHAETVLTRVTFRPLESSELASYPATGEGMDKAGAYAVQGRAAGFVSRIEGSHTNVVGLPACEVVVALRRLGVG